MIPRSKKSWLDGDSMCVDGVARGGTARTDCRLYGGNGLGMALGGFAWTLGEDTQTPAPRGSRRWEAQVAKHEGWIHESGYLTENDVPSVCSDQIRSDQIKWWKSVAGQDERKEKSRRSRDIT